MIYYGFFEIINWSVQINVSVHNTYIMFVPLFSFITYLI